MTEANSNRPVFSVSDLQTSIALQIQGSFKGVRVQGELSNCKYSSGKAFFADLKDSMALLSLVCWYPKNLPFELKDGMEVIIYGDVTLFKRSSRVVFTIKHAELSGEGQEELRLQELKEDFIRRGYFSQEHKRSLPFSPHKVGVITSSTGDAIHDIQKAVDRNWPVELILYPAAVQGITAVESLIDGIHFFNTLELEAALRPEVIILGRGGGSKQDLAAFDHPDLIEAIFHSQIPIISAVGHDKNEPLSDFVADARAATPTAAVGLATPVFQDIQTRLLQSWKNMTQRLRHLVSVWVSQIPEEGRLLRLCTQLFEQQQALLLQQQEYFHLQSNLYLQKKEQNLHPPSESSLFYLVERHTQTLAHLSTQLEQGYKQMLLDKEQDTQNQGSEISILTEQHLNRLQSKLSGYKQLLHAFSYHEVLNRGFVRVLHQEATLSSVSDLPDSPFTLQFHDGYAEVQKIKRLKT